MLGSQKRNQNRKHDSSEGHEVEVEAHSPATGNLVDYVAAFIPP
jgi:hypothetical protein